VREAELLADLARLHEQYELLVVPTCASRGLLAGDDYVGHAPEINGWTPDYYLAACMTPPFNICSRSPVLAVPSGFADNGLPTSVQLVARSYDDVTAFRAGAGLERMRPWAAKRPMVAASTS
jgi:amidase